MIEQQGRNGSGENRTDWLRNKIVSINQAYTSDGQRDLCSHCLSFRSTSDWVDYYAISREWRNHDSSCTGEQSNITIFCEVSWQ